MRISALFWIATVFYLLLAMLSKSLYRGLLPPVETAPLLYALAFLGIMWVSHRLEPGLDGRERARLYLLTIFLVLSALGLFGFLVSLVVIGIAFLLTQRAKKMDPAAFMGRVERLLLVPAVVLLAVPLLAGSVPLFDPVERYSDFRFFYLAAGYLTVALISIRPHLRFFLLGEVIALLSTFRTVGLSVALAYVLGAVGRGNSGRGGWRGHLPLLIAVAAGVLVLAVRYLATLGTYPSWHLGFLETLLYRPGFTYTVYERLFEMGMPLGRRGILFSTDPKGYVGSLFGSDVGYTYTIFGQPAYDFGILGLLEAGFLGLALADSERTRPTGILAVTFLILMIPIGMDAFFLSALSLFAYISLEVGMWAESG